MWRQQKPSCMGFLLLSAPPTLLHALCDADDRRRRRQFHPVQLYHSRGAVGGRRGWKSPRSLTKPCRRLESCRAGGAQDGCKSRAVLTTRRQVLVDAPQRLTAAPTAALQTSACIHITTANAACARTVLGSAVVEAVDKHMPAPCLLPSSCPVTHANIPPLYALHEWFAKHLP